jgi:hypothetical protein
MADPGAWEASGIMQTKILFKTSGKKILHTKAMSYDQDRLQLRSALDRAGVEVYMKVTHVFRGMLAEMLSEKGCPLHEIGLLQLWEVQEVMLSRCVCVGMAWCWVGDGGPMGFVCMCGGDAVVLVG